ncbi:MAG: hypothetical protein JEZ07_17590 [Phycisphaerae bacterium]|nr:hypothetical protein [Phycisphaerae bacterium]
MNKKIFVMMLISIGAFLCDAQAQSGQRERPRQWDNLVTGGRFMDRFEPIPAIGKLTSDTWGADNVVPRYVDNGIEDRDWSYWGGNAVLGDDGKYHLFVCRWAEDSPKGHMQWPQSVVVHAVADNSFGPYKVKDTIGKGHNPEIFQLEDGKYVIYVKNGYCYVSDSVNGPWTSGKFTFNKRGRKIIEGLSNLSFAKREDGSYLMVCRGGGIWFSQNGISPYNQITDKRVYPPVEGSFEDPVVWRTDVQYHMIVNDWYGRIAYYLRSKDGIDWKVEPGEAYMPGIAVYEDGTKVDWYKYERIKVLQDKYGRATQAHFAVIDFSKWEDKGNDNHSSKHICIPLTAGRLLTIIDEKLITDKTKTIKVKIEAEPGFDPHKDIDIASLRFGASEEVNFGRGCKVIETEKAGKDLVVVFDGNGNGITKDNFAAKLLGKTNQGKLLFGYARLPWLNYIEPALTACPPTINKKGDSYGIEIEVQNFGQVDSKPCGISIVYNKNGRNIEIAKSQLPALEAFAKTNVELNCGNVFEKNISYDLNVIIKPIGQKTVELKRAMIPNPVVSLMKGANVSCQSGQQANPGQGWTNLIDGKFNTKLCLVNSGKPVIIDFELKEPETVASYCLTAANDVPLRDPKAWIVKGSNDRQKWQVLANVKNNPKFKTRFGKKQFDLQSTGKFKYYRFVFNENHGDSHFQLSELELYEKGNAPSENVRAQNTISLDPIALEKSVKDNFLQKKVAENVLVDPGYRIWGMAVIKWKDGKYHGYYARWPDSKGHDGWMTDCEIAHAVADKPEGPFKTIGVVIESRNADGWDIVNAHNPAICVADGKICLYYISNKLRGKFESENEKGDFPSDKWMAVRSNRLNIIRNTQCIGVATATDPAGPFVRAKKPVVQPHGTFKNIAVNPAVTYQNGKFVMIMKGDDIKRKGWFRMQLVGHADKPEGPFVFQQKPVYAKAQTEDAGIWYDKQDEIYYMVCHVMGKHHLMLFYSRDSVNWSPADNPIFLKKQIPLADGTIWKPERLERPFVLTDEDGKPFMVYVAVADKGVNSNIAMPLEVKQIANDEE